MQIKNREAEFHSHPLVLIPLSGTKGLSFILSSSEGKYRRALDTKISQDKE